MAKTPDTDYQALFNALSGRYIAFLPDDPNFTIIAESDSHAEVAMVHRKDTIGKPLFDVFPDTSETYQSTGVSELVESLRRVIKTGKPDAMPLMRYDLQTPEGGMAVRYWRVTHYPVFSKDKALLMIYQATEDITAEVSTGTELERTQQQLQEALSVGLIGTWLWDVKKDVVVGDKYMASMFDVSAQDAAEGLPLDVFTNAIHPDDRLRLQKEINDCLAGNSVFESEYRTQHKNGAVKWLIARGRVERDNDGQAVKFPGVLVDITERKQVETNLKFLAEASLILSSSLEYTKTLNSTAQLLVPGIADWCTIEMYDEDRTLQQVAVAHKDPSKVKWALELRRQQGPPDLEGNDGIAQVMRTGTSVFVPYISDEMLVASATSDEHLALLRKLGLTSAIVVSLTVQGEVIGAITLISAEQKRQFTHSDLEMAEELASRASLAITNARLYKQTQMELAERKRLEEALRIANEGLEQRVIERTQELGETNVNLQRSNQELQDFAYVASHDLQEPLRKIQAFGNLLEEEYSDQLGEGKDYLTRMRSAAARMSALIEDILSFSRVTTKARDFVAVDLNVVVEEVLEDLETRIKDTDATIHTGTLPTLKADPIQMRQLFQNLIANALKFHKPDAAPVIHIKANTDISQTHRSKQTTITIEDNGVGFDEKYLDRIFAVFQRLHSRDAFEGTGIGLAVCRKIVERHGGAITAASEPGKGATFIITLPVHHKKGV